jgi:hypothetical protein
MKLRSICENLNTLLDKLQKLRPHIAKAAQIVYDDWEQEVDGLGVDHNGICDEIANQAIGGILAQMEIDYTEGGHDGDDHAYLVAYDENSSYMVDIPYVLYERGGGYQWEKIPGVEFEPEDVEIVPVDRPD